MKKMNNEQATNTEYALYTCCCAGSGRTNLHMDIGSRGSSPIDHLRKHLRLMIGAGHCVASSMPDNLERAMVEDYVESV